MGGRTIEDLLELVKDVTLTHGIEDKLVFTINKTSDFTVRTTYNHLQKLMKQDQRDILSGRLFKHLWSCSAPSKYLIHGWRVVLNRIAVKSC
jgi:hypothetical protein